MVRKVRSGDVEAPRRMSADEFRRWIEAMGYTDAAAAKALGVSKATVVSYKRDGAPGSIRMACKMLYPKHFTAVFPWESAA